MHKSSTVKKYLVSIALFVSAVVLPFGTTALTIAADNGTGVPDGASAVSYTLNTDTGKWENEHYTWDPVAHTGIPKDPVTYICNTGTGKWDASIWKYSTAKATFRQVTVSVDTPPAGAQTEGGPTCTATVTATTTTGTETDKNTTAVGNQLDSTAQTGNATGTANTTIGDATSGDATGIDNVMNLVNSSVGPSGSSPTTFTANITGNVTGDIMIDPGKVSNLGVANTTPVKKVTVDTGATINNDINVDAHTGDATLASNTTAGNVTTGDANAVANIMNLINSNIATGQSFVGVINIQGNLDGDILLPPDMLSQLLASNAPTATVDISNIPNAGSLTDIASNMSTTNNVALNAASGNATADANTVAGDVTTGQAKTKLTVLNLTGHQVIGDNALLVFVNVLGKWVGMIINAPDGTTAAALGGGITNNTSAIVPTDITAVMDSSIINNVALNATTGNALASRNTRVGNVTSGDATASANIVNIQNTQLSLSSWFGILFINVFGSWNGSFGINTAAGNLPETTSTDTAGASSTQTPKVFSFVPSSSKKSKVAVASVSGTTSTVPDSSTTSQQSGDTQGDDTVILGATTDDSQPTSTNPSSKVSRSAITPILGTIVGVALLGTERLMAARGKRRSTYQSA